MIVFCVATGGFFVLNMSKLQTHHDNRSPCLLPRRIIYTRMV
jgi:hypothetical protein